ncbi:MAG: cytochrome c5 family protein [Gammaproteobacteria bacterium]|nr:cytochrome c5 family protein [Gammaproteobacteria bacterium]MDH3560966.1 cytochrome c5 family protein [Gammaproteobacteria bacterium]
MSSNDKQFATAFITVLGGLTLLVIILFFIASYLTKDVSSYKDEELTLSNIEPVGKVNIDDGSVPQAAATPAAVVAETAGAVPVAAAEPLSGEQIYQRNCMACHTAGAAGAPKLGDVAAWAPRIGQGMDTLMAHVTNGLNAMPPKGLCMTCSEAELKSVVDYIISQSQ